MADLYFKINYNLQHTDEEEIEGLLHVLHKLKNYAQTTVDDDDNGFAFVSGDEQSFPSDVMDEIKDIFTFILKDKVAWEVAIVPEAGDPI